MPDYDSPLLLGASGFAALAVAVAPLVQVEPDPARKCEPLVAGVAWASAVAVAIKEPPAAEILLVHGREYLCVLKDPASFAGEQLHSLTTSLGKVLQSLRRFSMELNKPQSRWKENQIRSKIQRWLSRQFLEELIRYQIERALTFPVVMFNEVEITPCRG